MNLHLQIMEAGEGFLCCLQRLYCRNLVHLVSSVILLLFIFTDYSSGLPLSPDSRITNPTLFTRSLIHGQMLSLIILTLVAKPIPGTIFWTQPQHPPSSSNHIPSLTESDQELWESLEGLTMVGE